VKKRRQDTIPLKPMVIEEPFQQWGLYFIGVINPNSSVGHKFILTAIDYFTRWSEATPCKSANQEIVIEMIKRLITHFDIPHTIVSDNGSTFIGVNLSYFTTEYMIY